MVKILLVMMIMVLMLQEFCSQKALEDLGDIIV